MWGSAKNGVLGKKWGIGFTILYLLVTFFYVQFYLEENLSSEIVFSQPMLWMGFIVVFVAAVILAITVCVFINVTEEVRLQIEAKNRELENSNSALKNAIKSQERFIANTSHELRTPLNAIMGFSRLLSNENLDKNQIEYVGNIINGTENLTNIVNDILDYSKVTSGKLQLNIEEVYIENILTEVISLLSLNAEQKGLRITMNIDKNVPEIIISDSKRLKQVLINLIGNAVKFTTQGFISVEVSSRRLVNNNIVTFFKITDTGIGIQKSELPFIFDVFSQIDTDLNRNNNGSGLGLAISKELVSLLGGKLKVKSEYQLGSVFTFSIKTMDVINSDSNQSFTKTLFPLESQMGLKILIVDDNSLNRQLASSVIQSKLINSELVEVNNGFEAIEKASHQDFDVILMDLHMPKLDGIETAKIIRNTLQVNSRIIAITADILIVDKLENTTQCIHDWIIKPYVEDLLISKILEQKQFLDVQNQDFELEKTRTFETLATMVSEKVQIEDVLKSLFCEMDNAISDFKTALKNKNIDEIQFSLHSIKNNMNFLKFESLNYWMQIIERQFLENLGSSIPEDNSIDQFERKWKKIKSELIEVCCKS